MYISLDWLKDFVKISENLDPKDLADLITLKTAEVDGYTNQAEAFKGVVVGEILTIEKHPNADKLNVAQINIGKERPIQVIFGQMVTMKVGFKIPVAVAPVTLPTGNVIEKRELRGVMSEGMLCLDQELGLKDEGVSIQFFGKNVKAGTPLAEALDLTDVIFEIDNKAITNRPDLWGHYGIAREVAVLTNSKLKVLKPKITIPSGGEKVNVEVKNHTLCPRFCGLIINNVKVKESPGWLKKRLKTTGHGTHNNIVDITNYVMAEIGHPMHAFDKNLVKGGLVIRMAEKDEKLTTLDNKERILTEDIGVVADHERALGIAGIIGGRNSEINKNTTSIILEAANWHPAILRRGSIKLGVRTDAVQRFEKSLDPHLAELAIKRAAELILKICKGAIIAGEMTDIKHFNENKLKIEINFDKARSKIGIDIPSKDIKNILKKLEFKLEKKEKEFASKARSPSEVGNPKGRLKETYIAEIPTFRSSKDVTTEDDLIEEIARIYGYEEIATSLPALPTKLPEENTERFKKHRARELFSYGLGFDEVYNYSFYGLNEIKKCLLKEEGHIKLLNYLSEDQTHLRISLIPGLIKNLELNTKYFDQIKIYEIGRTYKEIGQYYPLEEKKLSGAICLKDHSDSDKAFFEAKGAILAFLEKFNIQNVSETKGVANAPYAHPLKELSFIDQNGVVIAQIFMLHPEVQKNYDLEKYSIAMFEINFTEALKLPQFPRTYKPLPKFPSINIDISVVIDRTIEVKTIQKMITDADTNLIKLCKLFDTYEGPNIEEGKKAVAFTITLQAEDKTLTDEEMSSIQSKIFANLEHLGGKIRGKN